MSLNKLSEVLNIEDTENANECIWSPSEMTRVLGGSEEKKLLRKKHSDFEIKANENERQRLYDSGVAIADLPTL